jgi:hypothetical protein
VVAAEAAAASAAVVIAAVAAVRGAAAVVVLVSYDSLLYSLVLQSAGPVTCFWVRLAVPASRNPAPAQ